MYPLNKYKFFFGKDTVYAVSTYAGETVRGKATCHENDVFNPEVGKIIAAARCEAKVAKKRMNRAEKKMDEAQAAFRKAELRMRDMQKYYRDASTAHIEAHRYLESVLQMNTGKVRGRSSLYP